MRPSVVVENVIRTLKAVAPWPVVKSFMRRADFPVTRGFDELHTRLSEEVVKAPDGGIEIARKLAEFLKEYHLHGEKQLTLYRVADQIVGDVKGVLSDVESAFRKFEVQECDAASAFPFTLMDSDLGDGDSIVSLVHVKQDENFVHLVFSTTITGDFKETFTPSSIDSLPEGWQNSQQIIVVRKRVTQVLPVVTFDKSSSLIQVKVPMMGSFAVEDVIRNNVVNALNKMLRQQTETFPGVARMINFYPAISKIYSAEGEGKVIELGFNTDTGSAKLERMKSDDLREELWHGAGKAALQTLTTSKIPFVPFRLAVRWDWNDDDVELILPGSTRTLIPEKPELHHGKITGTGQLADFQKCVDTLLRYLP